MKKKKKETIFKLAHPKGESTMDDTNFLLTEEFITFSTKIKSIYENKKIKKAELKSFYDKTQAEIKSFDDQAKSIEEDFNKWKDRQMKGGTKADE
jgi:hypothetical protein